MDNEIINDKQGFAIVVLFIIGSAIVLGIGEGSKQDAWLTIIISMFMALPLVLIYCRILSLFPGKNFFGIVEDLFGVFVSKVIAVMFTWYCFHLGALVLKNFSEFITVVSIPETPQIAIIVSMGILCIWLAKDGVEVLGRWAGVVFPMLFIIVISQVCLSMTEANIENLKPVLYNGIKPVIMDSFSVLSFPYAETVIFMLVFTSVKNKFNTYKVYFKGIFAGAFLLLIASIRNILVLGPQTASLQYFPSYAAVGTINIANFIQRIEVVVSVAFILAGIVKVSICLMGASKGFSYIFNFKNYRVVVVPIGLLMMNLACLVYDNIMEMFEFATKIYPYYAIPFQIILPLIIWVACEIKNKKNRKKGLYRKS